MWVEKQILYTLSPDVSRTSFIMLKTIKKHAKISQLFSHAFSQLNLAKNSQSQATQHQSAVGLLD